MKKGSSASALCRVLRRVVVFFIPLLAGAGCDGGGDGGGTSASIARVAEVRGTVFGGTGVEGATVAFVEAFGVAESGSIQPLEDTASSAVLQAVTDRDGEFRMEVDPGRYFVYVIPADDDTIHLPGGNLVRESISLSEGSVSIFNITLSERPPDTATYVGSSTCLACHPSHETAKQTLHFLGFRKLTAAGIELSSLQDLSKFPDADAALSYFVDGNSNDNTGASNDGFGYRIATSSGYNILLGLDGVGYFQAMESLDSTLVSERLYIVFTYGGEARFKQRYVTRLDSSGSYTPLASAGSYYMLPGQFSETQGDPERGGEVTVPLWVTYHPERWAAPVVNGGPVGQTPAVTKSFDNDCASCHFTGMTLTRNADGLFQAHAVADPGGTLDFDGDGQVEEMNVGCERCHGPGSEHAANGEGSIVQPEYLPPGRANLICGQCHTRGTGNATIDGEGNGGMPYRNNPDTGEVEIQRAGITPAEFYGQADGSGTLPDFGTTGGFWNPIDFKTNKASWKDNELGYGSEVNHSKSHRQQYMDHARSEHAHNPFEMLACWSCHDPHERERRAQVNMPFENNVLCLSCHAGFGDYAEVTDEMVDVVAAGGPLSDEIKQAIDQHTIHETFEMVGVAMNLGPAVYGNPGGTDTLGRCTTCHMPKTAKTASWITDRQGFVIRGDISSHTFVAIAPQTSEAMALDGVDPPIPNSCVDCHRGLFRGAFPDYRYKANQ